MPSQSSSDQSVAPVLFPSSDLCLDMQETPFPVAPSELSRAELPATARSVVRRTCQDNVFCTVHISVQFAVNPQQCEDAILGRRTRSVFMRIQRGKSGNAETRRGRTDGDGRRGFFSHAAKAWTKRSKMDSFFPILPQSSKYLYIIILKKVFLQEHLLWKYSEHWGFNGFFLPFAMFFLTGAKGFLLGSCRQFRELSASAHRTRPEV